jgi:hypothetical protein
VSCSLISEPKTTFADVVGSAELLRQIGDAIERISLSRDEEGLIRLMRETATLLGASSSYFVTLLRDDRSIDSYSFLLACDPVWACEYEHSRCYLNDSWLVYAASNSAPRRGTDSPRRTDEERSVALLAENFGFRSTVIAPAPNAGSAERLGLLVIGSDEEGFFEGAKAGTLSLAARAISMALHERRATLALQEFLASKRLRPSELELLSHQRQGRCSKTIAHLMGTSPDAIDARFVRLIRKLHCPDRRTAANLAAAYGLV